MIITTEAFETFRLDAQELLQQHYEELTLFKEHINLEPNWDSYLRLEQQKNLVLITARDKGVLVGYTLFFLTNHMHYKSTRVAINDVLFLHKNYRKGFTGIKLLKEAETVLKALGVDKIMWHVKFTNNFGPILQRMGYVNEEIIFSKMLKE